MEGLVNQAERFFNASDRRLILFTHKVRWGYALCALAALSQVSNRIDALRLG